LARTERDPIRPNQQSRKTRVKSTFETFRRTTHISKMNATNHLRLSAQRLLTQSVQKCAKVERQKSQEISVSSNKTQIVTCRLADFWNFETRITVASKVAEPHCQLLSDGGHP
jgi:hypothetical protein